MVHGDPPSKKLHALDDCQMKKVEENEINGYFSMQSGEKYYKSIKFDKNCNKKRVLMKSSCYLTMLICSYQGT
jgi:hypothetical protein